MALKFFPHLCHSCARLVVVTVQCFVQPSWWIFQLTCLTRKCCITCMGITKGQYAVIEKHRYRKLKQTFIGVWQYSFNFGFTCFPLSVREQSAGFSKPESFPELGSTTFRSSGFWLSPLEIATALGLSFPWNFPLKVSLFLYPIIITVLLGQ